jgi:tetratricopeptide (TPR) repeat protein
MTNATMTVAGAALALALGGLLFALNKGPEPAAESSEADALLAEVRDDVVRLRKSVESAVASRRDRATATDEAFARLDRRLTALENRPVPASAPAKEAPEEAALEEKPEGGPDSEFRSLMDKVMDGTATADEQTRFWKLARETDMAEQLIGDFEKKVEESPKDTDSRMNLAQAYIAKLLSIPGGPEQGVWAMKAENQWREVIKLDENHWEANYSIGESWNWYPEQLGKTPDAINQFEKVRKIQEGLSPQDEHAKTYLRLSQLYNRQNNTKKSREALKAGLERHPGDEQLTKALETMGEEE